jgi:hypothetical protein
MTKKIITSAIFLVSVLAFQHSWAGVPLACSNDSYKAAHEIECLDGVGIGGKQDPSWGNNGDIKRKTAETVASNKAKLVCHQKFSKPADAAKLKDCLQNAADLAP